MTTIEEIQSIALQKYPINYVGDANEQKRLAFIEGYNQAIIDNNPSFAENGDYCAVCGCDEFWNDNNED
jgi:hypothetical protein